MTYKAGFSPVRSQNTHKRLQEDPSEWHYYHTLYSEKRKTWKEIPYMEIAKNIKQRPDWIVADMGCGENLLAKEIGNMVHAFDHFAIEDSVTACDISNVPMDDESVNAVVFSLALMGSNYLDYLKEGYRILKPYGHIFISEPAAKWEGKEEKLREQLEEIGFKVFEATRNTERFIYIDGVKQ